MKTESVYRDALKVSAVIFILGIIEFILFSVFAGIHLNIFIGTVYGCAFASANFFYLARCVNKCVEKEEKAAKAYMSATYTSRMLLTAVMIVIAAKVSLIHFWAAIIPLVFTRISVMAVQFIWKRRNKE